MVKNYSQFLFGVIIGIVLGLFISKQYLHPSNSTVMEHTPTATTLPTTAQEPASIPKKTTHTNTQISQKVFDVLSYILSHHAAMDGYVGGRVFTNRERIVPEYDTQNRPIHYQEWDVNAKIQGEHRDAERILTGSDGRNWYTRDHYKSFTEIK